MASWHAVPRHFHRHLGKSGRGVERSHRKSRVFHWKLLPTCNNLPTWIWSSNHSPRPKSRILLFIILISKPEDPLRRNILVLAKSFCYHNLFYSNQASKSTEIHDGKTSAVSAAGLPELGVARRCWGVPHWPRKALGRFPYGKGPWDFEHIETCETQSWNKKRIKKALECHTVALTVKIMQ